MLKELLAKRKKDASKVVMPAGLQPEDPVNYNSVLDYLVGLSDKDYSRVTRSAEIYRKANKEVAKVIGVKDEPTTSIATDKPEVTDEDLDNMLLAGKEELTMAFLEDGPEAPKPKKAQSTETKVEVKS